MQQLRIDAVSAVLLQLIFGRPSSLQDILRSAQWVVFDEDQARELETNLRGQIAALPGERKLLTDQHAFQQSSLLPIERFASQTIGNQYAAAIDALGTKEEQLKSQLSAVETNRRMRALDESFQRIDLQFLSTRRQIENKFQAPVFLPYSLTEPEFVVQVSANGYFGVTDSILQMPLCVQQYYADLVDALGAILKSSPNRAWNATVALRAAFTGVIPQPVKQKIAENQQRFDELFLIAEAPTKWAVEWVKGAPSKIRIDPLVIGRKEQLFWLVDKFDLTDNETWAANQHSRWAD